MKQEDKQKLEVQTVRTWKDDELVDIPVCWDCHTELLEKDDCLLCPGCGATYT